MPIRLACTRCGGEGHTLSHCPWPAEATNQEKTVNQSNAPRITIQDLAQAPRRIGVDLAARQDELAALYAVAPPRRLHEASPAQVIKAQIEALKLEAQSTRDDIAGFDRRKAENQERLQAIEARVREFEDIYHRMLG